jgi:hypothetical protein
MVQNVVDRVFAGVQVTVPFFPRDLFHQDNGRPPRMPPIDALRAALEGANLRLACWQSSTTIRRPPHAASSQARAALSLRFKTSATTMELYPIIS